MRPAMQQHLRQAKGEYLYCLYLVAWWIQSTYVRSGFKMIEEIDALKNIKKGRKERKKVSDRQQTSALAFKTCSDAYKNIHGMLLKYQPSFKLSASVSFSPTYTSKKRTTLPSATNAGVRVCLFFFFFWNPPKSWRCVIGQSFDTCRPPTSQRYMPDTKTSGNFVTSIKDRDHHHIA